MLCLLRQPSTVFVFCLLWIFSRINLSREKRKEGKDKREEESERDESESNRGRERERDNFQPKFAEGKGTENSLCWRGRRASMKLD